MERSELTEERIKTTKFNLCWFGNCIQKHLCRLKIAENKSCGSDRIRRNENGMKNMTLSQNLESWTMGSC